MQLGDLPGGKPIQVEAPEHALVGLAERMSGASDRDRDFALIRRVLFELKLGACDATFALAARAIGDASGAFDGSS